MEIFDKAQWHIDGGEMEAEVVAKFREVFNFLNAHGFLSEDGLEIYEFGIDSSISLTEKMVTVSGAEFLRHNYDNVIGLPSDKIGDALTDTI